MYAVVDVETTGIFPGGHDRVVEVAVIQVDAHGGLESTWSTLLNPGRDLGPQSIHGIQAADILDAPSFHDAAAEIASRLSGRVLVGHNVSFDARFLQAEFSRCGWPLDLRSSQYVCTMKWAPVFLDGGGCLADCCELAGVTLDDAHEARADALATAGLLQAYLQACRYQPPWPVDPMPCCSTPPAVTVRPAHRGNATKRARDLMARFPSGGPPAPTQSIERYAALVDQALLDGHLSQREIAGLTGAGHDWGITREQAVAVHTDRLRRHRGALTRLPCEIGALARALGVDVAELAPSGSSSGRPPICLRPGDRVAFTGTMARPREEYQQLARAAGLIPQDGVNRKLTVLVAADPDSLSGKARRAASLGIAIVSEQAFVGLLAHFEGGDR